ncbi:MAG: hypothetical protein RLZZ28_2065 [Bacteroidota bacterium]
MNKVTVLINQVAIARNNYLDAIKNTSEADAQLKPDPGSWNIIENTEHLFWAEQGGILGMWKTIAAIRNGTMEKKFESAHKDMGIEELIAKTWKPKEEVPAVAAPRMGGTLAFWLAALASLQLVLEAFGKELKEEELKILAHPHPISGEVDFQQRLEFLSFHLDRHRVQVSRLIDFIEKK